MITRIHQFILVFTGLFIAIGATNAQNLIVDPGFEDWDGTFGWNPGSLSGLIDWYEANGTADYHNQDPMFNGSNLTGLEDCPLGEGNSNCGFPHEGAAVLGCYKGNGPDGSREWAGIQLSEPMVSGACYEVSFWIQNKKDHPDKILVTNQWGMFFNHTEIPFFNPNLANYAAMADHWVASDLIIQGSEWIKLEFEYQASEDFEYAYIGFMGDYSTSSNIIYNDDYLLGPYVWIDEVVVKRVDPQLTLTDDIAICAGESITIEAASNFNIIWQDNNSQVTSRTVIPDQTTTYYVQTLDSTLCTVLDSIVVTVYGEQTINFSGESICDGASPLILDASIPSGSWSGAGITDASQGLFDPSLAGVGDHLITYISDNDCSENFTMNVEVTAPPMIDFEADHIEGCPPLEVQFSDMSPVPGIEYNWDFGNGDISNDQLTTSSIYTDLGSYDVSLEVIYSENCKNTQTLSGLIEIFEHPVADFTFSPSNPSNLSPAVHFQDASTGNLSEWFWNFGNGNTSDKNTANTFFDLPGIYDISLLITSVNGCVDSVSHQVLVNSIVNFYTPNVFSPNDDGVNDLFEVYTVGPVEVFKLTVFNRWGGIVFQSNDINTHWDGKAPGGNKAAIGVYTYSIEYDYRGLTPEESFSGVQTGDVMVMR
jgi:gliding motility-associated-like protein